MTKDHRENKANSSATTMTILAIGGILVLALVGWALSRSMSPQRSVETPQASTGVSIPADTATTMPPTGDDQHGAIDKVKRISVEEAKALYDAGNVTMVDVRDEASFESGHIKGALHIPMARMEGEISLLPKSKPIVAYCT